MTMADFVIQTKGLMKNYRGKNAIDDLTIDINSGGLIGLIGRNGSGKTTFMKMCSGLIEKSGGTLSVLGQEPMDNLEILKNLVYTYHNVDHNKGVKLIDIVDAFGLLYHNFDKDFALGLIKYFDLNIKLRYSQLSQGMGSIFNFICALSCRAELTMLDEPVLGMDVTVRRAAYEVLLRDYIEHPRTIILSSHLLGELEGILSEIILIDNGSLIFYKDIDEVNQMAYRVDGSKLNVESYCIGKKVIFGRSGEFDNFKIVTGTLTEEMIFGARKNNISLSKVGPEELYLYMTQQNKEGDFECLWQKQS
jgi:ABC-2 type transport system ATP-binding protein